MKKQFVVGMMIAVSAVSFSAHAGSINGAKSVREVLVDYVKEVKKYAFGGKTSASDLNAKESKQAQDKMMNDLKLSAAEKTAMTATINGASDKAAVTNSMATILAAKNMAAGKSDEGSLAINKGVDASMKLMTSKDLIGAKKSSTLLNTAELADTNVAVTKLASMPEKFLTFETKELNSYTEIINKADELTPKNETYEDAFVKAIMEVKGVNKEQAMEMVRKLKECV